MRVFLAGATGVIGVRLVPLLVAAGHEVVGMTRTPAKAADLSAAGAESVVCDVFDSQRLDRVVSAARPDLVMHQLTDLPDDVSRFSDFVAGHNRIRREGTANLVSAARMAGVERLLAQSVAWELPGDSGAAVEALEASVLAHPGTVIRYGQFYGRGTYHPDQPPPAPRIHIEAAAARTIDLLDSPPGVIVVSED